MRLFQRADDFLWLRTSCSRPQGQATENSELYLPCYRSCYILHTATTNAMCSHTSVTDKVGCSLARELTFDVM